MMRLSKETHRQLVVNRDGLATTLGALPFGSLKSFVSCGTPPRSVEASAASARPSRMKFSANIIGLPVAHTATRTERQSGMKVGGSPTERLAAPFATLRYAITSTWMLATDFAFMSTLGRAIDLLATACARAWLAAYCARLGRLRLAPAIHLIAAARTKAMPRTAVLGMKVGPACSAFI